MSETSRLGFNHRHVSNDETAAFAVRPSSAQPTRRRLSLFFARTLTTPPLPLLPHHETGGLPRVCHGGRRFWRLRGPGRGRPDRRASPQHHQQQRRRRCCASAGRRVAP
uniref:Uncharacterized protein n=1 Tax=Hyalomma excavatum TaxID=257692 RepID=A0A131XQ71_9ACAR